MGVSFSQKEPGIYAGRKRICLSFRFKWIILPDWISYAAAVVFLIAYALYAEVLRENAYLSRTVEVQKN